LKATDCVLYIYETSKVLAGPISVCIEFIESLNLIFESSQGGADLLAESIEINQVWSMDFTSDSLANGSKLRTFNVMGDYNLEGLTIEVDKSLPSPRVMNR